MASTRRRSVSPKPIHWGPIIGDRDESNEIKKAAEEAAHKKTGVTSDRLSRVAENVRDHWYGVYSGYFSREMAGMPTGWYLSDIGDAQEVLKEAAKLA
jgi:hypothetical protein